MAQYASNDGKLLLDILYRINQTEDIVSFGKTALFFIRTYRNFSSGMFFSLKALNNDVIIDTAVFDDDKPPSRFDQFLNGRYDNDKLLKAMTAASDSCAFRDEDLFGQKELLKSDLYRNFITPEGFRYVARIELMDGSTPIGQFVLLNTAEEGDFDNGFIGLCNTLAKHLSLKARQLQRAAEVTSLGLSKAPEELKRLYGLSDRECEIALLIANGLSDREISEALVISTSTVRKHVHNTYEKMGVNNRAAFVQKLFTDGKPHENAHTM